jgi:hypothetical protein
MSSEASKAPQLLHSMPVLDGDGSLVNIVTEQWLIAYTQSWVRTCHLMGGNTKTTFRGQIEKCC